MSTNAESATIVISRKRGRWRDRARSYIILVDGEPVSKIKNGQRAKLPVSRGTHELWLKIDWCTSRSITFDAQPGNVVEFFCEPGGPVFLGRQADLDDTDRYIRLTLMRNSAAGSQTEPTAKAETKEPISSD